MLLGLHASPLSDRLLKPHLWVLRPHWCCVSPTLGVFPSPPCLLPVNVRSWEHAPCWRQKHITLFMTVLECSVVPPLLFCRLILKGNRNSVTE